MKKLPVSFLAEINKREILPKIYALYFKDSDGLDLAVAFTLEEAIAKVSEKKGNFPYLWEAMELDNLKDQIISFEMKES
jgi:hypothetical protein